MPSAPGCAVIAAPETPHASHAAAPQPINSRFMLFIPYPYSSGADGVHSTTFGISTLENRTRAFAYPSCPSAK